MASVSHFFFVAFIVLSGAQDFEFERDPDEVMIAQESRHYQTVVKPPIRIVKPTGVTNSHRPQYNLDSLEHFEEFMEPTSLRSVVKNYKSSNMLRAKEGMVKDAVLKAMERREQVGKFAQILPIIRAMSGPQRLALASLVANQVTSPPGRAPLSLAQVRSMFSSTNTSELMLPILLDMANLIRTITPAKKHRQLLRRSYTDVDEEDSDMTDTTDPPRSRTRRIPNRHNTNNTKSDTENAGNITQTSTTEASTQMSKGNISRSSDNGTSDLMADSTNQTLAQDLPVAEKLRALNRYIDRKVPGNFLRRGTYPPKPYAAPVTRRTEYVLSKRRPAPARKATPEPTANCELFTNTLCLLTEDYPTDAIVQSIRRNKAAAGALLADFKDPGEGALDGVTAAQESKYTADHYLVSNRRGDTANRDFASAGEAGFMCPSSVKYARPQRARATSGQWKYIVNTGEHTQTLRLEKCLKPKDACTYLTDNFKSKCVQVYNYHRLLTWDQQNGLHMDIFKVPTCCSCHIEGYSVSFPPLGHRIHETSSEHFPGDDLSSEQGNNAFEAVQSTIQRPSITKTPFSHNKPESFSPFGDNSQNIISGSPFSKGKLNDNDDPSLQGSPIDSYGNTYYPDSFNQASSIRNVRRPLSARTPTTADDSVTLPSYLEPPTPSASNNFPFVKEAPPKYKSQQKRGQFRPSRRPIRKKISGGPEDLISSGSSAIESVPNSNSAEDFNEFADDPRISQASVPQARPTIGPKLHAATTEKVSPIPQDTKLIGNENFTSNGKRINYNYHPIIEFFEDGEQERQEFIDREDSESYVAPIESEWKPINHPSERNVQSNSLGRKKLQ